MNNIVLSVKDIFSAFVSFLQYKVIKTEDFSLTVLQLAAAFSVFIITKILLTILRRLLKKRMTIRRLDVGRQYALVRLLTYTVWIVVLILYMNGIGVKFTLLLAGSAALLVGLGFGLQQIFSDFISGLIILFEGTMHAGDVIEIDDAVGKVTRIGLRTSNVITRDDVVIRVPNSRFIVDKVVNRSEGPDYARYMVQVGVAYGTDVLKVKQVLVECAGQHPLIEKYPVPFVRFSDFGESSLDFQVFFWTKELLVSESIRSDVRFAIYSAFQKAEISIPFPQRDLHLISGFQKTEDKE